VGSVYCRQWHAFMRDMMTYEGYRVLLDCDGENLNAQKDVRASSQVGGLFALFARPTVA